MACVGKPVPYVQKNGCLDVDPFDLLRSQVITQQLSAAGNNTRHPQRTDSRLDPSGFNPDTVLRQDCASNGQYLRQPIVGTTSTLSGSTVILSSVTTGTGPSFGGGVYDGANVAWYPYPAGSCGRGYQSPIMYGPTSVRQ